MNLKEYLLFKNGNKDFLSSQKDTVELLRTAYGLFIYPSNEKELNNLYQELKPFCNPIGWVQHFLTQFTTPEVYKKIPEFLSFYKENKDLIEDLPEFKKLIKEFYGLKNCSSNNNLYNKEKKYFELELEFINIKDPTIKQEFKDLMLSYKEDVFENIKDDELLFISFLTEQLNLAIETKDYENINFYLENYYPDYCYKMKSKKPVRRSFGENTTEKYNIAYNKNKDFILKLSNEKTPSEIRETFFKYIGIDYKTLFSDIYSYQIDKLDIRVLKKMLEPENFPEGFLSPIELFESKTSTSNIEKGRAIRQVSYLLSLLEQRFELGMFFIDYFQDFIRKEISQDKVYPKISQKSGLEFLMSYAKEKAKTSSTLYSVVARAEKAIVAYEKDMISKEIEKNLKEEAPVSKTKVNKI